MRMMKGVVLGAMLTLAVASLGAGETLYHPQLGLRLSMPDGFVREPGREEGEVVYAFQRLPTGNERAGTVINVSRMGGTFGRDKPDPAEIAAKRPGVTILTEKWKGFDIEVFRMPQQAGDVKLMAFGAQVPLKPEAVQVIVIGEAAREDELPIILRSVLASLDGETNWLNAEERMTRLERGITKLVMTVGVLAVIGFVLWRAIRKRKATRGGA